MNILITGGAGYIGSHTAKQLLENTNYHISILDNLSTGSNQTLKTLSKIRHFEFTKLDLKDFNEISIYLSKNDFDIIFHFSASIIVPESVKDPIKYYMNNTINTTNLLKLAIEHKINRFIFSSTAAVYGEPLCDYENGIDENYPTNPINPYGKSKLMSEDIIQDIAKSNSEFKYIIFRYFNVSGADMHFDKTDRLSPRIGQSSKKATNLIKIASLCGSKKINKMYIFGDDYDTNDGTCERDFIHVDDLASAHIEAIRYLDDFDSDIFNVGYKKGYSVKDVIKTMKDVSKNDFQVDIADKRVGDPSTVIADNTKILHKMNWVPKYDNLDLICKSSYEWEINSSD